MIAAAYHHIYAILFHLSYQHVFVCKYKNYHNKFNVHICLRGHRVTWSALHNVDTKKARGTGGYTNTHSHTDKNKRCIWSGLKRGIEFLVAVVCPDPGAVGTLLRNNERLTNIRGSI